MDSRVPDLMRTAEALAREAGDLIRRGPERVDVAGTKSSATDVVTAMDLAVETLIRDRLRELRPDDGVLGEEDGLQAGPSGLTWVVDPIDGTVNFLYGLPVYGVSIAVVQGRPDPGSWTQLAGCVHNVPDATTWTAGSGAGAWQDGRRLPAMADRGLDGALLGTGFGYRADRRRTQGRVVSALLPRVRDIRRIGAASVDLCLLAAGALDGHFERGLNPWDMAAGALLVTEVGGVVTGLRGNPAGEAMTVAGPPTLVAELCEALEELGADADTEP
ncbi:inositol monophosphatase family protein [Isoptericola sp. b441]|uniref:Inositol-1-monophosphatase n=1 Tax=Actinotalea lenta TaxID=3064654 RepID=A0ABT9DEZ0_9CELL|nr:MULTISPECIES: inositol monophosphatase family protein [unclassified Isoptericola]MDO8107922.1 inositol monophosphatase family protein [Isoptericola sp. b441]MDO8120411.1 inositol monophosphatase family protein [Isoptericola sp. b490]